MRSLLAVFCALALGLLLTSGVGGCSDPEGAEGTGGTGGGGGNGGTGGNGAGPAESCAEVRAAALRACVWDLNQARRACYLEADAPCPSEDPELSAALAVLETEVREACTDGDAALSVNAWVARLQTACLSETQSIASRSFGGPHGAVWTKTTLETPPSADPCLAEPHRIVSSLVDDALSARNDCLWSNTCDAGALAAQESSWSAAAVADILTSCDTMSSFVALEPHEYVSRTMAQLDCLTAIAHEDTDPLVLWCGPTVVARDPPSAPGPDGYVRVVFDSETYGTLCGVGGPFVFFIKLAPPGHPIENVLIYLEGGGACMFEEEGTTADCYTKSIQEPWLFEASSDQPHVFGIMSPSSAVSPFAAWTKVFVPYCTQDLHMGNGVTNHYTRITVHRYGAINTRAALRYVRDLLWAELDAQGGDGFRPDRIKAAFAGFSAGGWGALYNYHWVLDDLQWLHTTAFPDSALALDNIHDPDGFWSLRFLANFVLAGPPIYNWGAKANQPPYCFGADCAVGPDLLAATSPRLKAVPGQQYMIISNQNDEDGQMRSTFFDQAATISFEQGRVNWINEARESYCETKDLNGIHYFFRADVDSLHSTTMDDYWMTQEPVDGQLMNSWMADAFTNPNQVVDRTQEGELTTAYPGVDEFPCEP